FGVGFGWNGASAPVCFWSSLANFILASVSALSFDSSTELTFVFFSSRRPLADLIPTIKMVASCAKKGFLVSTTSSSALFVHFGSPGCRLGLIIQPIQLQTPTRQCHHGCPQSWEDLDSLVLPGTVSWHPVQSRPRLISATATMHVEGDYAGISSRIWNDYWWLAASLDPPEMGNCLEAAFFVVAVVGKVVLGIAELDVDNLLISYMHSVWNRIAELHKALDSVLAEMVVFHAADYQVADSDTVASRIEIHLWLQRSLVGPTLFLVAWGTYQWGASWKYKCHILLLPWWVGVVQQQVVSPMMSIRSADSPSLSCMRPNSTYFFLDGRSSGCREELLQKDALHVSPGVEKCWLKVQPVLFTSVKREWECLHLDIVFRNPLWPRCGTDHLTLGRIFSRTQCARLRISMKQNDAESKVQSVDSSRSLTELLSITNTVVRIQVVPSSRMIAMVDGDPPECIGSSNWSPLTNFGFLVSNLHLFDREKHNCSTVCHRKWRKRERDNENNDYSKSDVAVELGLRWPLSWIATMDYTIGPLLIGLHLSGLLSCKDWPGQDGVGLGRGIYLTTTLEAKIKTIVNSNTNTHSNESNSNYLNWSPWLGTFEKLIESPTGHFQVLLFA
ncbi:hypothetical protein CR513_22365, partial [Mucuna pruriens]